MTDAVLASSKASIVKGSKSFRSASRLFYPKVREDARLLYAWCRACNDEIDGQDHGFGHEELSPEEQKRRLDRLYDLTRRAMTGEPMSDPVFAAFLASGRLTLNLGEQAEAIEIDRANLPKLRRLAELCTG